MDPFIQIWKAKRPRYMLLGKNFLGAGSTRTFDPLVDMMNQKKASISMNPLKKDIGETSSENRLWQALSIVVVLLTSAVPAYVAYDLYGRGPAVEKRVELTRFKFNYMMKGLSDLMEGPVAVTLTVNGQTIDHLLIESTTLRNVGRTPILPSEFHENLSVNVERPWNIVAVESPKKSPGVQLRWKPISDSRFEAEPVLINPGDEVTTNVYLTNTQFKEKESEPNIDWRARITNLRAFDEISGERTVSYSVSISLSDWAVLFTIVSALLFQAVYLHLMLRAGVLCGWTWRSITLVLGAGLLSFAAAESSATYLFGNDFNEMFGRGVEHWMNAPWIVIHAAVLVFLYIKVRYS